MRKTGILLLVSMSSAVLLASGLAMAQTTTLEYPYYEFAGKWSVVNDDNATGIAVDSQDNIYVVDRTDYDNGDIRKFASDGTLLKSWSVRCPSGGIAIDSQDRIYVTRSCDPYSETVVRSDARVQKFNSNGLLLSQWGTRGPGDDQFHMPIDLAVDSQGNVYVIDCGGGERGDCGDGSRIKKFTSDGTFVTKWGPYGDTDEGFLQKPYFSTIAMDSQDNVYAFVVDHADYYSGDIQKFTSDGTFMEEWETNIECASAVTIDSQGNVFMNDNGGSSIRKFTSDGTFLTKWGSHGDTNGKFIEPSDVAVGSDGHVYVIDVVWVID